MSGAQGWTLLGLVGVLLSVVCGLMVGQMQMLRSYLDAKLDGMEGRFDARLDGMEGRFDARFEAVDRRFDTMDVRFTALDHRFDHLDRDVQSVTDEVFRRGRD